MYIYIYIYMFCLCICICISLSLSLYVYIYIYIYIYIYTQRSGCQDDCTNVLGAPPCIAFALEPKCSEAPVGAT